MLRRRGRAGPGARVPRRGRKGGSARLPPQPRPRTTCAYTGRLPGSQVQRCDKIYRGYSRGGKGSDAGGRREIGRGKRRRVRPAPGSPRTVLPVRNPAVTFPCSSFCERSFYLKEVFSRKCQCNISEIHHLTRHHPAGHGEQPVLPVLGLAPVIPFCPQVSCRPCPRWSPVPFRFSPVIPYFGRSRVILGFPAGATCGSAGVGPGEARGGRGDGGVTDTDLTVPLSRCHLSFHLNAVIPSPPPTTPPSGLFSVIGAA